MPISLLLLWLLLWEHRIVVIEILQPTKPEIFTLYDFTESFRISALQSDHY